MTKFKETNARLRHKKTGLWLHVENLGRPKAENDVYIHFEHEASVFKDKAEAIKVAKRLGLTAREFEVV